MKYKCCLCLLCFFSFCLGILPACPAKAEENRWIFCQNALGSAADLVNLQSLIIAAKAEGFNGIVLSSRFDSLDRQPPEHIMRLKRLHEFCKQNNFDLIPCGFSIGYASALLFRDKNLAEGFPVRNLMLKVSGGKVVLDVDNLFVGNFEDLARTGLTLEDPGKVTFSDATITHSGRSSLRLENFIYNRHGNARLTKELDVTPFQSFEISFWYRAEELTAGTTVKAEVYTTDGHPVTWQNSEQPTNKWKHFTSDFNSLEHARVRISLGVWGGRAGKLWIDDLRISRQKSLTRLVRRPGTPITVTDAMSKSAYAEGADYVIKESPQGSNNFLININPQGRIHENTLLTISYYRSYVIGSNQTSACMAVPEVYEIWKKQMRLIEDLIHPKAYFLSMDEIRQGGYCESCGKKSMAELIGECITTQYNIVKSLNKNTKVYVWGDMLDPNMGAINNYSMVKGGFSRSWEYVPKEILPVAWNYNSREASLLHFRKNGFTIMASINMDQDSSPDRLKAWRESLPKAYGKVGVMYTTWSHNYSHLKKFGVAFFD
jgi:hypothetical protein